MEYVHRIIHYYLGFILLTFLTACSSSTIVSNKPIAEPKRIKIIGEFKKISNEVVNTWEILDKNGEGKVTGISIPLSVLQVISKNGGITSLEMPPDIQQSSHLDHVDFQYLPNGSGSDVHDAALILRFYYLNNKEQRQIDCLDKTKIDPSYIPDGYTNPSKQKWLCEIGIGQESVSQSNLQDPDHPVPFSRLNFGYYKGKMVYIEVTASIKELLQKESFTIYIPAPQKLGSGTQIPANFTAVFHQESNSYDFSIWSFSSPESSQSSSI